MPDTSADLSTLTALDTLWNEAYAQGEPVGLASVLADDWQGYFPDGSTITRAQWLRAAPELTQARYTFSEQRVQVYGDTAISTGHLDARAGRTGHRQRYLRVWARRGGRWQAVAVHVSLAL